VSVAGPHRAYAAPGQAAAASQGDSNLAITVLSPTPHTSFSGNKPIEVSAFYQGSDLNQISSLELYVDGSNAFTKRLDSPESRGVISFLIDASQLGPGAHKVVVRAVAADAEVVSAKTSFIYVADQPAADSGQTQIDTSAAPTEQAQSSLPELSYMSPKADDQVQGTVKISLKATEPNGKSPYVSLFIDRTFKTLRNYAPYEFDWDTTSYTNGYHTIEAYGYDENQNVGPAQIVRVYVNNPGGRTEIRQDLKDGIPAPAKTSLKTASKSSPYSPTGSRDTKAMHSAVPTKPIDVPELAASYHAPAGKRVSPLKPLQVAKLDAITERVSGDTAGLSDPFVTTSGNSVGAKALGMARRPSPRMAMLDGGSTTIGLRPVMMASRTDVLDETGGLHSTSDLSDPFLPDTASPKPASRNSATPTTGFKPMPSKSGPALAKLQTPGSAKTSPALITRDAHTVPAQTTAPEVVQPALDLAVKTVSLEVAAPVAKTVKAQTPVAQPKHVDIHTPAAPVAKKVAVHTPAAAAAKMNVHRVAVHMGGVASLMQAKGEMKVLFNHTSLRLDRPITPRAGVMFSPLRQIFEFQGGSLTWQRKTGEVHAQSDTKNIFLHIGKKSAQINNEMMPLQMAPYLDDGRTMVPLSFLPMALDVNVQFDQNSGHLLITTKS
jgi:hypothetical protein